MQVFEATATSRYGRINSTIIDLNYTIAGADQGEYGDHISRCGVMYFKDLGSTLQNKTITQIELTLDFVDAGGRWKKKISFQQSNSQVEPTTGVALSTYIDVDNLISLGDYTTTISAFDAKETLILSPTYASLMLLNSSKTLSLKVLSNSIMEST